MENFNERAEREYKEWNERYIIPHDKEFQVKTLLKLQAEYNNTECNSSTTLTRRDLLEMITRLQRDLKFEKKYEVGKSMYVSCSKEKIIMYLNDAMYIYENDENDLNVENYVSLIRSKATRRETIIYIDKSDLGTKLYDLLSKYEDINVKQLDVLKFR
ncbi:hypothetical protein [Anaerovorax sp. IOR16]|uniref:hypothetical protein n=1 Tax=Anaerovorax sp. IOR16 TaxID=2773458 RepID=UPI0019D17E17|nr:hypothetical protein [Anaerovorax sp. IOR16]